MIKIGVISDTHGHLEPKVLNHFKGVDHIIHAGDIGLPWLLLELESVAPVTAVVGNNDAGLDYKEIELLQRDHRKFLVHHIVDPHAPADKIKRRIIRENPDVVILDYYLNTVQKDAADGMEILQDIKKQNRNTQIIMLSSQESYAKAAQTLAKGAVQYVIKDEKAFEKIAGLVNE